MLLTYSGRIGLKSLHHAGGAFGLRLRDCPLPHAIVKILACLVLALLVAGCIPIGGRVSNMYTENSDPPQGATAA